MSVYLDAPSDLTDAVATISTAMISGQWWQIGMSVSALVLLFAIVKRLSR